jgi:hypothetical protein
MFGNPGAGLGQAQTCDVRNPGPGLGQAQTCDWVKQVIYLK